MQAAGGFLLRAVERIAIQQTATVICIVNVIAAAEHSIANDVLNDVVAEQFADDYPK